MARMNEIRLALFVTGIDSFPIELGKGSNWGRSSADLNEFEAAAPHTPVAEGLRPLAGRG